MTNLLVTGLGSLGIAVIKKFAEENYHIISYDVAPPRPQVISALKECEDKVNFVRGDVQDPLRLLGVAKENEAEGIVHTAALTGRGSGIDYPTAQFSVNAGGVLNVLETARILDLKRVIFTSSISVFQGMLENRVEPLKETELINPKGYTWFYSVAKYSGEMLMHAYHNIYGLDAVTCRMHNIYGIAEINPKAMGSCLWSVMKGERITDPTGADNKGDFSYSGDLADGIYLLYTSKGITDPRVYHLSDGITRRFGDVVEIINTMGPGKIDLGPGKGGRYNISFLFPKVLLDISRAKKLGYKPKSIETSLEEYASWIKEELNN